MIQTLTQTLAFQGICHFKSFPPNEALFQTGEGPIGRSGEDWGKLLSQPFGNNCLCEIKFEAGHFLQVPIL